jgi:hypothetical protein
MASFMDDVLEQEGGTDATSSPETSGAIDSDMQLIGTRDKSAISRARLRAQGTNVLNADRMADAIRQVESGGDYEARGASGEYGAYQIMPATWKGWAGDLEQTPENQDKVVREKIGEWIKAGLTYEQIAAKWNSGSEKGWKNKKGVNKKGVPYDVPAYVNKVLDALDGSSDTTMSDPISTMNITRGKVSPEERLIIAHELGIDPEDVPDGEARDRATLAEHAKGVKYSYQMADLGMEKGKLGSKIKKGTATPEDFERLEEINGDMKNIQDEVNASPFVAKSFGTLAPFLVESAEKGGKGALTGGMIGGTMAFILGQMGPQAAAPEEILTVPGATAIGAKIGATFSSTSNIADIEGGSAYLDFVEMGMDKDKAALASDFVGTGSGLLEIAQFKMLKRLLPGSDKIASSAVARAVQKVMTQNRAGRGVAKLAGASLPEAGVETVQEFWNNVVEVAASEINSDLDKTDLSPKDRAEYVERLTEGLVETFAMTATGVGVAAVPGASVDVIMGGKAKHAVKTDPGMTLIPSHKNDKTTDVRTTSSEDGNPTVNDLMGVNEASKSGKPIDEDGTTLSTDPSITPQQAEKSHQTQASIESVLEDMNLKKSMQADKIDVINNENKLQTLGGLFDQAVQEENHEEALVLAEQYKATVDDSSSKLSKFMTNKSRRLEKDKKLLDPRSLTDINIYVDELTRRAGDMVTGQIQAIRTQEAQNFMDFTTALNEDPAVLKDSLVKAETTATNLNQPQAKIYRKVADGMDQNRWMDRDQFFGKAMKMDKLLELRGDLERKIAKEKEDVKVSGTDKAVDEAALNWVDTVLSDKVEYDEEMKQADRVREREAIAKAAETTTEKQTPLQKRQAAVKKQAEAVKTKQEQAKIAQRKAEEKARAKKTSELDKRRAAIQKQKAQVRKTPAAAVSEKRKQELEASKARKAAIEKQRADVAKMETKPHTLPKKAKVRDLQDKKSEYVILTPDNPQSTQVPEFQNRRARIALKKELDEKGIDYEIVDAVFEGNVEKSFIIKGMDKKTGKELSDRLNQSSYIHAKGENIALIEGKDANVVKKTDAKVRPDAEIYSVIEGKRWAIPFYSDKAYDLDAEQLQLNAADTKAARTKYRSAAIKFDGKVYEGKSHMDIIRDNSALEDFFATADITEIANKAEHGFVSHDGKFSDRFMATRELNLGKDLYLKSEDFIVEAQEQKLAKDGIKVVGLKKRPLKEQYGTLELMDELNNQMKTGKYKWLFDKTTAETIFVTQPGQYKSLASTKKIFPNMKALEDAGQRFDGGMKVDPKTGKMQRSGGTKGIYHKDTDTAIINLPIIGSSARSIDRAMETVVHEHVHGLHKQSFDKMSQAEKNAFGKEMKSFWDSIPTELKRQTRDNVAMHPTIRQGIIQADESLNEIVTYAMSHPEFANWLDSIPASPRFRMKSSKIKTMWDALVDMIVKTINPSPTKLTEVKDILNRHLKGVVPDARFSKEDITFDFGANVSTENVRQWTQELDDAAANGIVSTVVETAADAEAIAGFKIADNVASMWLPEHEVEVFGTKGKKKVKKTVPAQVVIIAENIQSQDHLVSKWMHEQVGHQGLRNAFPNNALLLRFLDQSFNMFQSQDKALVDEIVELYDIGKMTDKGVRKLTKTDKRLAAEEIIARRSESLKPAVKTGMINKFKNFLKRWLPKKFLGFKAAPFKMTDADIMSILEMSKANVMTGNTDAGILLQKSLDARAPKHEFKGWKTLPNFMFKDSEYMDWMREVRAEAPQVRRWYEKHQDTLRETFGKDADMVNILLSVTSPQADVNTNVIFAMQTYAYLMGLVDKPGALFANKLKKKIDEKWTSPKAMFAALESPLYKVTEFVRGLNGDPDATVGDLWMFRAFFGDAAVYNKENESYSVPMVVAMRQKIMDLAAQMSEETGETWTAREVQAAIWIHINAKSNGISFNEVADYQSGFNKPAARFDGKTPLEWLQSLVPNLKDGPLSEKIGITKVPMAPISPLAKKRLDQIRKELAAQGKKVDKFEVDSDGNITVSAPNVDEQILNLIDAIAQGGRRITVPSEAADWHRETFGFKEVSTEDGMTIMALSDDAVGVFTNPKGKVTPVQIRDNLGGFSGTYTQTARFSKEARSNLDKIASMAPEAMTQADADYLRTGNDGMSVTGKIHEWRDQSELNWNRFTTALEQDFLEAFGGRKSKVKVLGTGRLMNTPETELLQKAMNLYIDSGKGENLQRVKEYLAKLNRLPKLTNRQKEQVLIIDKMLNLTQEEVAWADGKIRPYYEDLFTFAQEHDILESHVEDYVKRSWKMPKQYKDANISWSGSGMSGFKLTPTSGKQRTLNSIVDGWDAGMDLNTEGIIGNLQNYGQELGYVFANRRFVKYMRSLITFNADSLMMEGDSDFKAPPGFSKVTDRGFVKPGKILYARTDFANELNKLGARPSRQIWDTPVVNVMRRLNAMIKSTILSVSLFHHLAGFRSYAYGVEGKGWKFNGVKAYKRGLKKIDEQTPMTDPKYKHLGPVVDMLVREGLTLGKTQDWDQNAIQDSFIEDQLLKGTSKMSAQALKQWQKARRTKRSLTTGLFGKLFAGLKAEAAAFEFGAMLKKAEKKKGSALNDAEIKLAAAQAATLVNADFGGLHLSRMGRNPDIQKFAQLIMLAPDWTESNWRTVTGMFGWKGKQLNNLIFNKGFKDNPELPGMEKVYRKFWKGVAIRSMATVAIANAAIVGLFGDDEEKEDYFEMLKEQFSTKNVGKGKWLSVPIDYVLPKSMVDPEKRRLLSVVGHFKDILKVWEWRSLIKHKQSPVVRIGETILSGTDWKGSRFTTPGEMFEDGIVPKLAVDNQFARDPEMGDSATLMSLFLYNLRQSIPIMGSELLQAIGGETSWISALSRAGGIEVRDTRKVSVSQHKFEKISSEILELDRNLKQAKVLKDQKMIFEARRDIKNYENYNKVKARVGFTKSQIAAVNRGIKSIQAKVKEDIELSAREEKKLQDARDRKQAIYNKALEILDR